MRVYDSKAYRKVDVTRERISRILELREKLLENWIGEQCSEIEENLRKNNSKRTYQLVKGLTTVKQGKATIVQASSGRCITEEREILNRWTKHSTELYNHEANGDPSLLDCPQTDTEDGHPILRKEVEAAGQWRTGKNGRNWLRNNL